ncbi:hypothetical protein E2C01_003820 [Portunus trituberculatus]|uniref:Uncharacterized protein n=1 Tax=Portunus trituberculatus TaxID=210409 RepID=A0A5B7CQS5_PORTR|nr:hypothetical protein [Portunus trituberculatus]
MLLHLSDEFDDAEVVVALLLAYQKSQQKRKCLWIRPWLSRRKERSVSHTLLPELRLEDPDTLHFS